jgi:spore germination protein GerM
MKLLIEGPKSEKLENTIPDGTKINKIELKGNILWIDFSQEFIENHKNGAEEESKTIYSIVNTMTQLNEVDGVKIVIDGKENCAFSDNAISLKDAFVPKDETT